MYRHKKEEPWRDFFLFVTMNCLRTYTESTESLISREDQTEDQTEEVGEDEVGEEMEEEEKFLTDEELRAIAEEVDRRKEEKKEKSDFVSQLLEHCINTILLEELNGVGRKMNAFRKALAEGVMKFAQREEAQDSTAKMDRFVDSFRAAWKDWKEKEDGEHVVNVFMKEMDNELWYPER